MNKLIVAALAVALGFAAQAGSFNWSYASNSAELDYNVYVILGSTVDTSTWESAADIPSANNAAVAKSGKSAYKATGAVDDASITSYDQQAIFVLVNKAGDQYKITDAAVIGSEYVMIGQDTGKGNYPVSFSGDWKDFGGSDVPEPTSGLLLLLGVAGLALRRKQK